MIAKTNRFTRRQFAAARKRMKSFRSGPFLFLYRTEETLPSRFAVVVKKKNDRRATVRNQFKRQVYNQLRTHFLPKFDHLQMICLHQGPGFDTETSSKAIADFESYYQQKIS